MDLQVGEDIVANFERVLIYFILVITEMFCCSKDQQISTIKRKRQNQRESDITRIQSRKPTNTQLFKQQLQAELGTNSNILKLYITSLDKFTAFEEYYSFVSSTKLQIVFKSICLYFQKVFGKEDEFGKLTIRLQQPYQLCMENKKNFKFITLAIVYFLQKILEGMSVEVLQMDTDFQNRKRQFRQHEADIWNKIQVILREQDIFRNRMAEKQQKINCLNTEMNIKVQMFTNKASTYTMEIKELKERQITLKRQNSSLKLEAQRLKVQLSAAQSESKFKEVELQKIKTKYTQLIQAQTKQKAKLDASQSTLRTEIQDLRMKLLSNLDQQKSLKKRLEDKQNEAVRLKNITFFSVQTHKDEIEKLNNRIKDQTQKYESINNQNLLLIQKQDDQINRLKSENAFLIQTQKDEVSRLKTDLFSVNTLNYQMHRQKMGNQSSMHIQREQVSRLKAQNQVLIQNHYVQMEQMIRLKAENAKNQVLANVANQRLERKNEAYEKLVNEMELQRQQIKLYTGQLQDMNMSLQGC